MKTKFSAALKDTRELYQLEQKELAELLGIKKCMVSKVESGLRSLTATEFLTLGLLFPNWFEVEVGELALDLKADLAARLRQFLERHTFGPVEYAKRDWAEERLQDLDGEATIIA